MENGDYVNTIYNKKDRPVTKYPDQLINYLLNRYNLKAGGVVLDSGCGRGDFAQAFRKVGMKVYGIDGNSSLDSNLKGIEFTGNFDLENDKLPYPDNYFDAVFSKSVLEHIHKPQNYLTEIRRVLKPGGRLILFVPDWYSQMYIYYDDFSHVQPYTKKGVEDTLKIFGFKKVKAEIFYQLPSVWKHPQVKIVCKFLQFIGGPVKKLSKNKFYRFSRELMILGEGRK
jgi:ubiquinone/menaquinone biosynthesis C-methylase UbiE